MAISNNYPDLFPSLYLNFSESGKLDPRISLSRASTGTYVDSEGIVRTAGINEPRFDYEDGKCKGLLVESERTNVIPNSYNLKGSNWYDPYGTITVTDIGNYQKLEITTDYPDVMVYRLDNNTVGNIAPNRIKVCYADMKAGSVKYGYLVRKATYQEYNDQCIIFNLETGVVTYDAFSIGSPYRGVIPLGNGFYRCWAATQTIGSTSVQDHFGVGICNSPTETRTKSVGNYIYVARVQYETKANTDYYYPSSYIPTTTAAVTRAPDLVTINDLSWFNDTEGTFIVNANPGITTVTTLFSGDDGSSSILNYSNQRIKIGETKTLYNSLLESGEKTRILSYSSDKNIIITSSDKEPAFYSLPPQNIVADGLITWLDAGNSSSYAGIGSTVWYDLSGNGNNGFLYNGVSYDSSNGALVFDGSDDYVGFNTFTTSTVYTVCCWFTTNSGNWNGALFGFGTGNSPNTQDVYLFGEAPSGCTSPSGGSFGFNTWECDSYGISNASALLKNTGFHHVTAIFNNQSVGQNQLWLDGVYKVLTQQIGTTTFNANLNNQFKIGSNGWWTTNQLWNGSVAIVQVYNRALTEPEIKQNYEVTKKQIFSQLSDISRINIGYNPLVTNSQINGTLKSFRYYPTQITDGQLKTIIRKDQDIESADIFHIGIATTGSVLNLDSGISTSYSPESNTWYDLSGNNNHAVLYNSPSYTSYQGGILDFDNFSQYGYVSPSSTTTFDASTSYTISLWFRVNDSSRSSLDTIFEGNGGARIWMYLTSSNSLVFNTYYGPYVEGVGYLNDYYQTVGTITDPNKWYNAVVIHDKTNLKQRTYLNGIMTSERTLLSGYSFITNSGGGFYINNGTFGPTGSKFGKIEVYNRVLSDTEITQQFNTFRSRFGL